MITVLILIFVFLIIFDIILWGFFYRRSKADDKSWRRAEANLNTALVNVILALICQVIRVIHLVLS